MSSRTTALACRAPHVADRGGAHFRRVVDWAGDGRLHSSLAHVTAGGAGHRWDIARAAIELEDRIVGQLRRSFHRIPEATVRDAYAEAWERACRPIGQQGAFPQDDLAGLAGWLHRSTTQRLLHVARDTARWRVLDEGALDRHASQGADPAEIVIRRETLARVASHLQHESPQVRAYFLADRVDGLKRHEIRARTGWSQDKVKHLRGRTTAFLRRAADAVMPVPLVGTFADTFRRLKAHGYAMASGLSSPAENAAGAGGGTLLTAKAAAGCVAALAGGAGLCSHIGVLPGPADHRPVAVMAQRHPSAAAAVPRRPATRAPSAHTSLVTPPTRHPSVAGTGRQRGTAPHLRKPVYRTTAGDFASSTFEAPPTEQPPAAASALRATTPRSASRPPATSHGARGADFGSPSFENGSGP